MKKSITAGALALAATLALTSAADAHGHRRHHGGAVAAGVAAGLLGGVLIGSAVAQPRYAAPVYHGGHYAPTGYGYTTGYGYNQGYAAPVYRPHVYRPHVQPHYGYGHYHAPVVQRRPVIVQDDVVYVRPRHRHAETRTIRVVRTGCLNRHVIERPVRDAYGRVVAVRQRVVCR